MERSKKKYTHMTDTEFRNLRLLFEAGLSVAEVKKVTGRSQWTCSVIRNMKTFQDYQDYLKELHKKRQAKKAKSAVPAQPPEEVETETSEKGASDVTEEEPQVSVAEMNKTLERIAAGIERLAEAWERKPEEKKKGIFG